MAARGTIGFIRQNILTTITDLYNVGRPLQMNPRPGRWRENANPAHPIFGESGLSRVRVNPGRQGDRATGLRPHFRRTLEVRLLVSTVVKRSRGDCARENPFPPPSPPDFSTGENTMQGRGTADLDRIGSAVLHFPPISPHGDPPGPHRSVMSQ